MNLFLELCIVMHSAFTDLVIVKQTDLSQKSLQRHALQLILPQHQCLRAKVLVHRHLATICAIVLAAYAAQEN
jgi:hypothetical protein